MRFALNVGHVVVAETVWYTHSQCGRLTDTPSHITQTVSHNSLASPSKYKWWRDYCAAVHSLSHTGLCIEKIEGVEKPELVCTFPRREGGRA